MSKEVEEAAERVVELYEAMNTPNAFDADAYAVARAYLALARREREMREALAEMLRDFGDETNCEDMESRSIIQRARAALSYLDWDDAAVGRFTKHVACKLEAMKKDAEGLRKVTAASCGIMLIGMAFDANADTLSLKMDGHTYGKGATGDWEIMVRRVRDSAGKPVASDEVEEQVRRPKAEPHMEMKHE